MIHEDIIDLYKDFGYKMEQALHDDGLCIGASTLWIESCVTEKEALFHQYCTEIAAHAQGKIDLVLALHSAREKIKSTKNRSALTDLEQTALEIDALFNSICLYQFPFSYTEIWDSSAALNQVDTEQVSAYASSSATEEQGGLVEVYTDPLIYNEEEIQEYLNQLGALFNSFSLKKPIGMLWHCDDHAVAFSYHAQHGWKYMNINTYPPSTFPVSKTKQLAKVLIEELNKKNYPYLAINVQILTTKGDPFATHLKIALAQFKAQHKINKEIALRIANVNWLHLAANFGHLQRVKELISFGANTSFFSEKGTTPLLVAAETGYAEIVNELAIHGADINYSTREGVNAAVLAIQYNHLAVIQCLIKNKANLEIFSSEVGAPIHYATITCRMLIVLELIKYGVNVEQLYCDTAQKFLENAEPFGEKVLKNMNEFIAQQADQQQVQLQPIDFAKIFEYKHIETILNHAQSIELFYRNASSVDLIRLADEYFLSLEKQDLPLSKKIRSNCHDFLYKNSDLIDAEIFDLAETIGLIDPPSNVNHSSFFSGTVEDKPGKNHTIKPTKSY